MRDGRTEEQVAANRANWDARAPIHAKSDHYNVQGYIDDPTAISRVVEADLEVLGPIEGLDVLHLQCHIGTDSLSLARRGANVTGIDFSPASLEIATGLAARTGASIEFICSDVRRAHEATGRTFDLVYSTVGILCWIPSIEEWAHAAAACVRPGGRLYLRDGHPFREVFAWDSTFPPPVVRDYFAGGHPMADEDGYTYTDGDLVTPALNFQWSHTLGDIVTALATEGLFIQRLNEMDHLNWQAFKWMEQDGGGSWRFPPGSPRFPLAFALTATKPG